MSSAAADGNQLHLPPCSEWEAYGLGAAMSSPGYLGWVKEQRESMWYFLLKKRSKTTMEDMGWDGCSNRALQEDAGQLVKGAGWLAGTVSWTVYPAHSSARQDCASWCRQLSTHTLHGPGLAGPGGMEHQQNTLCN